MWPVSNARKTCPPDKFPELPSDIAARVQGAKLFRGSRANPNARIHPLTHVSVDRADQAESVGGNSLVTILISIRRSPNL